MPARCLRHLAHADRRAIAAAMRGASRSDLPSRTRLATLGIPALILAWHADPMHPMSTALTLAETMPQATLHEARTAADVARWPELVREFLLEATVGSDQEKRTR